MAAEEEKLSFTVDAADAGTRLDRYLEARVAGRSRSALARLIRQGQASVDGGPAKSGRALRTGERVDLVLPVPEPLDLEPEDIPLDIVHQDAHLAVVNKPPGLVVHPAAGNRSGTLVHALLYHLDDLAGIGDRLRPGIVHRLDKDTSGLLVVAKTEAAHAALSAAIAERRVKRRYLALVWGHLQPPEGTVDAPLGRDPRNRKRMAVLASGGKPARTHYSRIDSLPGFDYIRLELETGRTHQIRVHLAHLGHPVLGDPLYGGRRARLRGRVREERVAERELLARLPRQALHAWRLEFEHPVTGRELCFTAPLPDDIGEALALLGYRAAEANAEKEQPDEGQDAGSG